ncbi:Streptothricin hydrolase [Marinomonas gallaica]|uniref:Streptothricin hydrolase n=1 Tax=Marinomonas gallaica TaxID=1806667 RepID=A0A1C3JPN1_9GAMM|nr:cysteine hydrolase family protein [Marinomonas gallaica]SBT17085.1 Streptothricin hydrolase [Marinomonas gallaica]SBT20608.1 Streptothricin hydrolase [Marinomonas gallaica]
MQTLIIIDQQEGINHPKLGPRNNPDAESVMLRLLAMWREHSWPVVHVIHRSTEPDSVFWPHQAGFTLKASFQPVGAETLLEKSVPCAFTNNRLAEVLTQLGSDELVVVGVATHNSIEATARTGGNLGYKVLVVADACFTFAKHDYFGTPRSADEVHAMSLANLDGEYATVVNSTAFKP